MKLNNNFEIENEGKLYRISGEIIESYDLIRLLSELSNFKLIFNAIVPLNEQFNKYLFKGYLDVGFPDTLGELYGEILDRISDVGLCDDCGDYDNIMFSSIELLIMEV